MTENQNEEKKKIIDRNLGDEWSEWAGDLSGHEKEINEGKALFLGLYFLAFFAFTAVVLFVLFLVMPRFLQLNENLDIIIFSVFTGIFSLAFVWSILLAATVITGIRLVPLIASEGLHVEWAYPVIYKIAGFFKISRDRVQNSMVKVNNTLVFAVKKGFKSEKLLVLLPRCLDKDTRLKVNEIIGRYNVVCFTATGGSSARQMITKVNPDAVIGVACERDLAAGMADAPKKIPVIGIENKRPEGPCKNTTIDTEKFEKTIKFLLKA